MKSHISSVVLASAIVGMATPSFATLVGARVSFPLIGYQSVSATALTYTASNGLFSITAPPTSVQFASTEGPRLITGTKSLQIRAVVDNTGTLISSVVIAGATALFIWARKQLRLQNAEQRQWKSGPNAYWGQPRQPKVMSETELYRLMLMQQMAGGPGKPTQNIRLTTEADDEPTITF